MVIIDVWFWREASMPLWNKLYAQPDVVDSMIGPGWTFEKIEGKERGKMSLEHGVAGLRDEREWPAAHQWICSKLDVLYGALVPWLNKTGDA